jgi:hypothetical protein
MRSTPLWILLLLCAPLAGAADLKDPTRPPIVVLPSLHAAAAAAPPPRTSAIFMSDSRRVAIFNGQPVQTGDSVGAYHIDEVTALGVRYHTSGHDAFAPLIRLP